jgi:hypothetical protein
LPNLLTIARIWDRVNEIDPADAYFTKLVDRFEIPSPATAGIILAIGSLGFSG